MSLDAATKQVVQKLVGEQYALPPVMHSRLEGDGVDSMREDAARLRQELGMPALAEGQRDERGRFAGGDMNTRIRRAAGRA